MREFCLNFEEKKIERDYELSEKIVMLNYNMLLELPIEEFNKKYERLVRKALETEDKDICLYINILNRENINESDAFYLLSSAARQTITTESTNINYMYTPLWFKDRVNCSAITQKNMGNFKNKFNKLQIILCTCNKETGEFEPKERLVN